MTKRQLWTGTTRPARVGGVGLALAILVGLGRDEFWTAQRTDSAPGVETKPNQRRTQNQLFNTVLLPSASYELGPRGQLGSGGLG